MHPYTFRNENQFLPAEDQRGTDPNGYGNAFAEDQRFFAAGVDGIFTDNPDTGVAARNEGGFLRRPALLPRARPACGGTGARPGAAA